MTRSSKLGTALRNSWLTSKTAKAGAWLGDLSDKWPRLTVAIHVGAVAFIPGVTPLGVVFGEEIRKLIPYYLIPYVALVGSGIVVAIASALIRTNSKRVKALEGIHVKAVEGALRDLQLAIMCRPTVGTEITPTIWREYFDNLAKLVERAVNGPLRLEGEHGVACNLMVALPNESEEYLDRLVQLLERDKSATFCFEKSAEGVFDLKDQRCLLLMCGRGPTARTRGYPWVCLRTPHDVHRAMPGAPLALLRASEETNGSLPHSYVPDPINSPSIGWGDQTTRAAQNAFAAYFTQFRDHVGSFVSVGLQWDGQPIGVLNIDCRAPGFLDDALNRRLALALLGPYTEIANALARNYRDHHEEWIKNAQ